MIYLDNSSTTHKKPFSVLLNTMKGVTINSINPSRAGYQAGIKTSQKVFECREKLANYLGTTPDQVILTTGCTMAINLGLIGTARKKGHIITTIYEHNSVLRTLNYLRNTHNITITYLKPNKDGLITTSEIKKHIRNNTYMIIINHTSNVTGSTQDIVSIGKLCKKHSILFFVDGAQSVGHETINMKDMNINLLSIAGHKGLYSPQGIGGLLINNAEVQPIIFGGTGTFSESIIQPTDYPDGLESGTPNIVGILGLSSGIDFVCKNQTKINNKITNLTTYLINELNKIKNVIVYSNNKSSGVVSFVIKNKDSVQISNILDTDYHICTRSGLHCAPLVHKYFKTLKSGMTRVSLSYFNKKSEINKLINAVSKIALN